MVLEVKNISKSYGKLKVLNEVSFDIKREECAAIIGKNGVVFQKHAVDCDLSVNKNYY